MRWVFLTVYLVVYVSGVQWGYSEESGIYTHFLYVFQHATLVHLLVNWFSFFSFYCFLRRAVLPVPLLLYSYAAAVGGSFFSYGVLPTVGASGQVCALVGVYVVLIFAGRLKVVRWGAFAGWCMVTVAAFAASFCFSRINGWNHLVSFVAGVLLGGVDCLITRLWWIMRR